MDAAMQDRGGSEWPNEKAVAIGYRPLSSIIFQREHYYLPMTNNDQWPIIKQISK